MRRQGYSAGPFFGGAGRSWSLIGKIGPGATVHWRMCTLHIQRERKKVE